MAKGVSRLGVNIAIGVLSVIVIGCAVWFGYYLGQMSVVSSLESAVSEATAAPKAASGNHDNMSPGESVTMENGLVVTVNEFEVFVPEYMDSAMTRVSVTYENTGEEKQPFNLLDWKAENPTGVERTVAAWSGGDDLGSGDLKAGGTVTGNVYFDGDDVAKVLYYSNSFLQSDSDIAWNLV